MAATYLSLKHEYGERLSGCLPREEIRKERTTAWRSSLDPVLQGGEAKRPELEAEDIRLG